MSQIIVDRKAGKDLMHSHDVASNMQQYLAHLVDLSLQFFKCRKPPRNCCFSRKYFSIILAVKGDNEHSFDIQPTHSHDFLTTGYWSVSFCFQ